MNLDARFGGEIVYNDTVNTGGMFDARRGVEKIANNKYRAYVVDWHGGVQCFRQTYDEAFGELERLQEKLFG